MAKKELGGAGVAIDSTNDVVEMQNLGPMVMCTEDMIYHGNGDCIDKCQD